MNRRHGGTHLHSKTQPTIHRSAPTAQGGSVSNVRFLPSRIGCNLCHERHNRSGRRMQCICVPIHFVLYLQSMKEVEIML
ncbi:hypothetical protein XELAEV_18008031mg [Xenopus laevis]|uniref:Uncharacterized protein n=1 Tax=Xenopus laevis TaxID=8355 RepID=A0A974E1Y9_XENLA|nr:hypothetical protein XELAEV_18008031mg [Xenopus laevis]